MNSLCARFVSFLGGFSANVARISFNKIFICTSLITAIFMGQACSFLHGAPIVDDTIDLSSQQLDKVSNLPNNFVQIFQGQLSDQQIRDTFDNLQYALQYFMQKTRGSANDAYSADDMQSFFGKYFLKSGMSPELAHSLMRLKMALIGGSNQWVTKTEITKLISLVGSLENEVVLLSPYMKVLALKDDTTVDWKKTNSAITQFRSSMQNILKLTTLPQSDYTFDDLQSLFSGLAATVSTSSSIATFQNVAACGPLLANLRLFLFGPNASLSGLAGWSKALDGFVDAYEVVVKSRFVLTQSAFQGPDDILQVSQFFAKTLNLLSASYPMLNGGQISFVTFDGMIEQAIAAGLVPAGLTAPTLEKFYRNFILKIFDPSRPTDITSFSALTPVHLVSIQREFDVWRLSQSFIDQLVFPSAGILAAQLAASFRVYNINPVLSSTLKSDPATLQKSWVDFGALISGTNALAFDRSGRIVIASGVATPNANWKSLERTNRMRSVTRLLMLGYGDKAAQSVGQANLLQADLDRWYADFQDIGHELKAFDPRTKNQSLSSFMEANFFTLSGNGDEKMSFTESFEYISFLFSAGLGSGAQIQSDMQAAGCELNELDIMGLKKLDPTCFENALHQNFAKEFANLPKLVTEVQGMSATTWETYFQSALAAARVSDPAAGRIEVSDLRGMVVILHYVESLLKSFDKDGSQTMSLQDAYDAFPRFAAYLRQTNPGYSDADLKDGFAYLLFYGYQPSTINMVGFKVSKLVWNFQAHRVDLLNAAKVIKATLGAN
jgi:hypothetical protein